VRTVGLQPGPRAVWWQHSHTAISLLLYPETLSCTPYQPPPQISFFPHLGSTYLMERLRALLSSADAHKGRQGITSPLPAGCSLGRHAACQTSPLLQLPNHTNPHIVWTMFHSTHYFLGCIFVSVCVCLCVCGCVRVCICVFCPQTRFPIKLKGSGKCNQ
jgi:hypothetical protein